MLAPHKGGVIIDDINPTIQWMAIIIASGVVGYVRRVDFVLDHSRVQSEGYAEQRYVRLQNVCIIPLMQSVPVACSVCSA